MHYRRTVIQLWRPRKTSDLQWTSTDADSKATRAAIQTEPAKTFCTCINQPLSPSVDTEADILLRLPPPQVHPPCLCKDEIPLQVCNNYVESTCEITSTSECAVSFYCDNNPNQYESTLNQTRNQFIEVHMRSITGIEQILTSSSTRVFAGEKRSLNQLNSNYCYET